MSLMDVLVIPPGEYTPESLALEVSRQLAAIGVDRICIWDAEHGQFYFSPDAVQ